MRNIVALFSGLLLVACKQSAPEPFDFSKAGIGVLPGCPALVGVRNVSITGERGPDFRRCKATHISSGKVLFDVYVGEHPGTPERGLRYGGTTTANGKTLIWFNTPTYGGWGAPRIWHTYLPTGSPRGTVMVVTLVTYGPGELDRITRLIVRLTPSR